LDFAKGEEVTIKVLELQDVDGNKYMIWNPDGQNSQGAWGFQYIVRIEIGSKSSRLTQNLTFYIRIPNHGNHNPGVDAISSNDGLFEYLPNRQEIDNFNGLSIVGGYHHL
jgi:hypothetical protein